MIAKSDLVILAISGTLLATGIYRWQSSLQTPTHSAVANGETPTRQSSAYGSASGTTPVVGYSPPPGTVNAGLQPSEELPSTTTQAESGASDSHSATDGSAERPSSESKTDLQYGTHTVSSGDNLNYIANLHGTSIETLQTINNIEGSLIYIDQKLLYPLPSNQTP